MPRRRAAARALAVLPLAPQPQGSSDRRPLGRRRPSGSRQAAPRVAFPSVSLGSAPCRLSGSPWPPLARPRVAMSLAPLPAPVAPALSHSDSLLPAQEGGCLARAAPLLSVRVLALGKEAPYLVAPRPPPRQHLPRGLAFVKLQVLGLVIPVLCSVKQPALVELSLASSRRLPVEACLGLEALAEGAGSSAALEGNPARMRPTKTHSAQPAGASDPQPPRIPLTCSETAGPRRSAASPARPSESRSPPARSAPGEAAWRPRASASPLQTKQVASVLLQCLAALLLLGDPLGLEGCQHSVQPQPLQALWARREAKCSERVLRPPAQEDSGLGAAATPRRSAPSPVRTLRRSDLCPSRLPASGPRAGDSLALDRAQEDSALEHLTRPSRASAAGEAEWVSVFCHFPWPTAFSAPLRSTEAVL